MKLRRSALFAGIVAALIVSGAAYASGGQPAAAADASQQAAGSDTATVPAGQAATKAPKSQKKPVPKSVVQLQAVQVVGISASQMRSIQVKRNAPNIEDSITAVNIGELPDVSITDSLQRLTGVQIDRSAGEGTSLSVRGLPEVDTTLNGMPFITADNIDSIQPNYGTLPASLFSGVDVFKSPTASMLDSGISGTVNLRTYRPFDFKPGWSASGSAKLGRGSVSKVKRPDASGTVSYSSPTWGLLLSASYSNLHRSNNSGFFNTGDVAGTNSSDASNTSNTGFLSSWGSFPIPSAIMQQPDGSVVVNGIKNGAFLIPGDGAVSVTDESVQKKREGLHLAFEANLGSNFLLNINGFYTNQKENDYSVIGVPDGINHNVATLIPLQFTDTGAIFTNPAAKPGVQTGDWNQNFYAVQKYDYYLGSYRSASSNTHLASNARNYSAELEFDSGSPFTASLQLAHNSATVQQEFGEIQFVQADGSSWGNHLFPGVSLPPTVYPGPPSQGGNYLFNPGGIGPLSQIATINMVSGNMVSVSPALASRLVNPDTYVSKGFHANGYAEQASNNYMRLDGKYEFSEDISLKFGVSNSVRSASDGVWAGAFPVYAGEGASDPNGCLERWVYDDQILDGGGVPGACTASNASGYYHGNPLGNMRPTAYPSVVSSNLGQYTVGGVTMMGVNPDAMTDPVAFLETLAPGMQKNIDPTASWNVSLHTVKGFGQADFKGDIGGVPFSGNFGLRVVRSNLGVTQFLSGLPAPYGTYGPSVGAVNTSRSYTDWLPAMNVAIDLTPSLVWRLALSKNMMPLTLDQWGGGLSLGFAPVAITLPNGQTVLPVDSASSNGNPNLQPWRSTNYGSSLEYYFSQHSMASIAVFHMHIASFVEPSASIDCDLPDADGTVRGRCVPVNTLSQGVGANLRGVELDYKQGLTFLPGLLSHTGFEVNGTYSPSNSGRVDLAGSTVPFPGNSEKSGNAIVWYQDSRWEARLAFNYRSKESVQSNFLGVNGLEEYEAPQKYVDANVSYRVNSHLQVFLQGQNLMNEKQIYYLTWPSQRDGTQYSERYFMLGVRGRF